MDQQTEVASSAVSPTRAVSLFRLFGRRPLLWVGIAAVLEVPGRQTGMSRTVTLVPVELDGTRYLLSTYGSSAWVRNLRSAGRGELRRKGGTEAFTAVEIDGAERDQVIAAFHTRTPKMIARDFDQRPAAADHPAFRIEPIT